MMDCIIIEDQPPAQRILKKFSEDIGTLNLKGIFSDAIQAMTFLRNNKIDLIFLDIHLPKLSGIDFLKTIQNPPHVILTTAFAEYALESYEFNVVDYLLKPFSFERFVKAISRVPVEKQEATVTTEQGKNSLFSDVLFLKSGYEHFKITINDIIYIQSDADYTEVFLKDKKYLSTETLQHWIELLNPNQFVRVHKSYIINATKIQKIVASKVYLTDGKEIPIGRTYKDGFIKRFIR
ncbi:MAG: DNA-binding response regulator [Thalassobius sp.]|nr:DNA-binding response regulator [Thalassovita sp.]